MRIFFGVLVMACLLMSGCCIKDGDIELVPWECDYGKFREIGQHNLVVYGDSESDVEEKVRAQCRQSCHGLNFGYDSHKYSLGYENGAYRATSITCICNAGQ